jgi:hypothetical protein
MFEGSRTQKEEAEESTQSSEEVMPLFCQVRINEDGVPIKAPVAMKTHVHSEATPFSEGVKDSGYDVIRTPAQAYKTALWSGKAFPEGSPEEALIASQANYSTYYAHKILKKRFPKGEPEIFKSPKFSYLYAIYFFKPKSAGGVSQRIAQMEDAIAQDPQYSYLYAIDVLWNKRFEKGEEAMHKDPETWRHYLEHLAFVKALPKDNQPPEAEIPQHPSRHSKLGALAPEARQYAFKEYKASFCQRMFECVKNRLLKLKGGKVNETMTKPQAKHVDWDYVESHIKKYSEQPEHPGFITPRGDYIDLSRNSGDYYREDHRAVGGFNAVLELLAMGYIRLKPEGPGFETHDMPAIAQQKTLKYWLESMDTDFIVDLQDNKRTLQIEFFKDAEFYFLWDIMRNFFNGCDKDDLHIDDYVKSISEAVSTSAPDNGKSDGGGGNITAPRMLLPFELNEETGEYQIREDMNPRIHEVGKTFFKLIKQSNTAMEFFRAVDKLSDSDPYMAIDLHNMWRRWSESGGYEPWDREKMFRFIKPKADKYNPEAGTAFKVENEASMVMGALDEKEITMESLNIGRKGDTKCLRQH